MASAQSELRAAAAVTLAMVSAGLLLGGVLVWKGQRSLMKPISELQAALRTLTGGDLSQPLVTTQSDEVGQLIVAAETLRSRLLAILGEVAVASDGLTTAAGEIADGTVDLSTRTERQAGALQQTASSMEQMSAMVAQNAQSAHQAKEMAANATSVAAKAAKSLAG